MSLIDLGVGREERWKEGQRGEERGGEWSGGGGGMSEG